MNISDSNNPFMNKGPKRKRLAKACDACHKSKRRCDGTAPCSNCYYASKQCTYTDASGRPVPAPRPFKPEKQDAQPASSSTDNRSYPSPQFSSATDNARFSNQLRIYPNPGSSSHQFQDGNSDDDNRHARKRFRNDRGNPMPVEDLVIDGPISGISLDRPASIELDPSLTRELTNLFFTHCHPARAIIHKPTFSSSLSHNRVPSHLLLAVCALAAPLSKQPRIRTTPSRFAGKPFAQEALSQMFDGAGRLVCEPDLAAAQALCILQMHDIIVRDRNVVWNSRLFEADLALQIVEGLGVHSPEHPTLTPVPSQEFVQASIEREALRRIFWLIHLLDVMASIYFKKPVTFTDSELRLRLPVDETSFELGVHSTLPEYLYLPAVRTQYASEFGHLIRILSIYAKVEFALDEMNVPEALANTAGALMDAEQKMEEWVRTLPEHLRFSEQSLQVQQSMFETSSNTGAWCWCCMHVYHASCVLALNFARHRVQRGPRQDTPRLLENLDLLLKMLGDRAKNSILMGAALWSLIKYCKRDDAQIRNWANIYEEAWGTKVFDMVQDWRSQPSPPQQHQYPVHAHAHSQSQSQQPQQQDPMQEQQQQLPSQAHAHGQHQQLTHRRLSDVRNTVSQINLGLNISNPNSRPPPHQHGGDYNSSSSNSHATAIHRSASNSPPTSYPLGRPPISSNNNNSNASPNRALVLNTHPTGTLPDSSSSGSGSSLISSGGREARAGSSSMNTAPGSGVGVGPALGHGNDPSLTLGANQNPNSNVGKHVSRSEVSSPAQGGGGGSHSRWTLMGGDADSAMQNGFGGSGGGMSGPGVTGDTHGLMLGQIGGGFGSGGGGAVGVGAAAMNGSGNGNGNAGQRSLTLLGDGSHSLPSLKDSGLLESWGSSASRGVGSVDGQKQVSNGTSQQQQQSLTSPRRTSPANSLNLPNLPSTSQHHTLHHHHGETSDLRPTTLGMPVGLQWLANESR
ncbi:fungal-specific transcription factor domain-containing protein [Crassisporium funariophilum]|nr:fungal-specific transcription factor domain-containing protein [Crassisporium funariophilum]